MRITCGKTSSLVKLMQSPITSTFSVALLVCVATPSYAALGGRTGQTELQSNTGTAVQQVCVAFLTSAPAPATSLQTDLFTRCGEMVHSANALDGTGTTTLSLGLTEQQLAESLQNLASEEAAVAGSMATETSFGQVNNVTARMAAIRGAGTGLQFGNRAPWLPYPAIALEHQHEVLTGGGASGDLSDQRWSTFVNGDFSTGEKDPTPNEDGFDFDTYGITIGADYRISNQLVAGAALGYSSFDSDLHTSSTVAGGQVESDGYGLSLYATYFVDSFYLESVLSFGMTDLETQRNIVYPGQNRTARSETDSDQLVFSIGAGIDFNQDALSYGPYVHFIYSNTEVDGYQETGAAELNLQVQAQDIDSKQSVIGFHVSNAMSHKNGVIMPHAWLEWHHEFDADGRVIRSSYVNDPNQFTLPVSTDTSDSNFFTFGLGISTVYAGGTQAFINYQTVLGLDNVEEHILSLGIRHEY